MSPTYANERNAQLEARQEGQFAAQPAAAQHALARSADLLQIRRTTLVEKMRKYGISRK